MDTLEEVGSDDRVQIGLHKVEDEIQVFVILGADDGEQSDDVLVAGQLLEEHDLG